ncbi:hypothetical protein [Clostridium minihomine]|uniref:hypothetical protein n=1 Tax=Clostridium minihomine TaxID=2045012 RepID=UPI000C75C008|nr:hypothetical protein [Clostridium minihomine]
MSATGLTPEQIERTAMHNDSFPAGLTQPEQLLFLSFRCLYVKYRAGTITRDQAQSEKREILRAFEDTQKMREIYQDTCRVRVELGGYSKEVESGDCERCKKIMGVLDGRIKISKEELA